MAAEPKSGKLFKLNAGLLGAKWSEKWAHWDGRALKCFPIASEQQSSFSWAGARHSNCAFDLADYSFTLANEKKLNRKHVFHLIPNNKAAKPGTFACVSDKDLAEWRTALTHAVSAASPEMEATSIVAEKVRRVAEVFSSFDPRRTGKLEVGKLRVLLREISSPITDLHYCTPRWQGEDAELSLIQQQLDPTQQGRISRGRLLRWLTNYYNAQHVMERVQNEKAFQAKREKGAGGDLVLPNTAGVDDSVAGNQLHPRDAEIENTTKRLSSSDSGFDWNALYYELQTDLSTADPFVRGLRVAGLVNRFRETAEEVVCTIVEELLIPDEAKSIRPLPTLDRDGFLATDGVSSSTWLNGSLTRHHHDGMLVYMAVAQDRDSSATAPPSESFYPIDIALNQLEFTHILKHQIKAAEALRSAIEECQRDRQSEEASQACSPQAYRLCVPLQCTVDYLGFRCFVIASKATRIESKRSLSSLESLGDAKEAIKSDLQSAFDRLGLLSESPDHTSRSEHTESIGGFTLPAFFPCDAGCSIEVDGGIAVIMFHNLASLFPPIALDSDGDGASCYKDPPPTKLGRLRHEFVHQHGSYIPLSADAQAISGIVVQSKCDAKSSRDVGLLQLSLQSACEHLVEVVIPSFIVDLEATPMKLVHSQELIETLHGSGINVKFLGKCFTLATQADTKRFIMCEMLARAAKVELGASLRAIVYERIACSNSTSLPTTSTSTDNVGDSNNGGNLTQPKATNNARLKLVRESATRVVIEFFNLMFGAAVHPDSKAFWENRILPRVRDKFALHGDQPMLTFESIVSGESVHLPQLFHAVQMQTNVIFLSDHPEYNFRSPSPVSELDLVSNEPKSRIYVRTTAECEEIIAATDELIACDQLESALDNVKFRLAILNSPEGSDDCQRVTLSHYLTCAAELSLRLNRHADAREYANLSIEVAPKNHAIVARAHTVAMKLDGLSNDVASADRHFVEAVTATKWHLGPSSSVLTDIFMTMVDVCSGAGELERAKSVLADCAELTRLGLGRWSLPYADVRRRQAMLMYNRWQPTSSSTPDEVLGVLHDAIAIYERHLSAAGDGAQLKLFAASCYCLVADMSCGTKIVDGSAASCAQNAYNMALKALKLRKEALPSSHGDILESNVQLATLASRIGEPFRAMEYYRQALAIMTRSAGEGIATELDGKNDTNDTIDRIRDISRAMLQLFLGALSTEQQDTVDKTKWLFASLLDSLHKQKHTDAAASPESKAMSVVIRSLFLQDPVEYATWLIDRVEHEMLASPGSPLSCGRGAQSSGIASNDLVDRPPIQTPGGDVSFGAQLAIVLFLAETGTTEDTTV